MTTELLSPETELQAKQQFALALLRTPEAPYLAAIEVFGADTARALVASSRWVNDTAVRGYMQQALEEHGEMHFLPSQADVAREAWKLGTNENVRVDERLKALRLYADVRGFIASTVINNNNNNNVVSNVMIVQEFGSNDEWEGSVAAQQAKLMEGANAPRKP